MLSPPERQADSTYIQVLERIAEKEGEDSLELPPLRNTIDPEALDNLFQSSLDDGEVVFSYHGYQVTVTADGQITIE
ncbi:HalOD1 output domain-containing protein [Natrinema sp. 1APR25-10V2]|uniref:HalOD1 output domain-containing protein n=1 Tax=Natrinema sp. 1APR25-10V2 TaxID=2951081 RepID=UPI0028761297|nr:HalOD1 output domain-containing protein [Natrinema sp. 1APR25-10V2]MDS0477980.1 hypothetical protein [Natrinema sp. 1APR25-10V2]